MVSVLHSVSVWLAREPELWSTASDRNRDCRVHCDGTAAGCTTRNRGGGLGGGVFVAWRAPFACSCDPLLRQLGGHARRLGAHAAAALADDGRAGGSRRHATVRYQHCVHFHGDAVLLPTPCASATRPVQLKPISPDQSTRGRVKICPSRGHPSIVGDSALSPAS